MEHPPINAINYQASVNTSAPSLSASSQAGLSDGSWNCIVSGDGYARGFGGPTSIGANTGSRKMLPIGSSFGGIKDIGSTQGSGSFFEDIGRSRWGIGAGQPAIEGVDIPGFTLSSNLQVSVRNGGTYSAPDQAGLNQPSAPEIGVINSLGDVSNSISAKIERRRPSTGARSLASPTSAVVVGTANRIRITFPAASSGQTHWRVYFTFQGFGGTGIHYLAKYGTDTDIPESTVAAGTVDGIARSLEFNYKDGDLVPLEASYDDYPPPAATHAIRLESVLNLAGCYSDSSSSSATSTNTGTAIAVSKINNYESYVPTHLLFLPEQITDCLSRPIDDFGYIGCENSIHAIQFVGYRGDTLPPCTITTVLPDIGVQYPHNWTHFRGRLAIYTAEGSLLLMDEQGNFDTSFAAPIIKTIKNWQTADTIVGYDPKNDLLIIANGKRIFVYSFTAGIWRQIWLPDFGVSGVVTSCIASKRKLYISITSGSSVTAYSFDTNSQESPMSFVCNYQTNPGGNGALKDIFEIAVSAETASDTVLALCVSKNLMKNSFREISVTSASGAITDGEAGFSAALLNKKVIIFADDIGGAGVDYIIGKVSVYTDADSITLTDLSGNALNPQITGDDLLMFAGEYVAVKSVNNESKHFPNFFPNIAEARSYAVACWMKGGNDTGNVLSADVFGLTYGSGRAL